MAKDGDIVIDQVKAPESRRLVEAGYMPVLRWQRDGLEVSTKTALEAVGVIERIDLPALRLTRDALRSHRALLSGAYVDLLCSAPEAAAAIDNAFAAVLGSLNHVIDNEYRSARGGD